MYIDPWESTKKISSFLLIYIPVHDFNRHKEIYETYHDTIFIYYFMLQQIVISLARKNVKKNSLCYDVVVIKRKILERIGQISAKFTLGPVPPSDNPSLGFHSLMFHFDGVCGVSPGRRFATRFIGRLFIFARFCQSRRGGRPIPGCRSLS